MNEKVFSFNPEIMTREMVQTGGKAIFVKGDYPQNVRGHVTPKAPEVIEENVAVTQAPSAFEAEAQPAAFENNFTQMNPADSVFPQAPVEQVISPSMDQQPNLEQAPATVESAPVIQPQMQTTIDIPTNDTPVINIEPAPVVAPTPDANVPIIDIAPVMSMENYATAQADKIEKTISPSDTMSEEEWEDVEEQTKSLLGNVFEIAERHVREEYAKLHEAQAAFEKEKEEFRKEMAAEKDLIVRGKENLENAQNQANIVQMPVAPQAQSTPDPTLTFVNSASPTDNVLAA